MIELYDHQRKAINAMFPGCILVGDVGSGKTLTSLVFYKEHYRSKKLMIITTAKKRDTNDWKNEAALVDVYPDIIDSWNNISKYVDKKNYFVIFDEAHQSGMGKWGKSFLKMSKNNLWIILSATPADNYNDLKTVFIAKGYFKNQREFNSNHVVFNPHTTFPMIDRYINTGILEKYRRETYVDMDFYRDTKQHHEYVLTSFDKQKYDIVMKKRWNIFSNEPIKNSSELCYALRRVVNEDPVRLLKLTSLFGINKRIIVYYNFDYELDMLRSFAKDLGVP